MKTSHWKEDLVQLLESSCDRDPGDLITDICALAAAMGEDSAEELLNAHPQLYDYAPTLTRAYCQRVLTRESPDVRRLLERSACSPASFKAAASDLALELYDRSLEMFDRLDFSNCHRLVMVGCGSLPFTIFHVHDRTTIPEIVGLDVLPQAIETAATLAARLGYGRVRTELCDGRSYDYGQTQIVYVAGMVSPKSAIVSRIADTAPDGVQIVVREPYSLGRLWLEGIEHDLDPRLEVTGRGRGGRGLNRDVFLKRRA